MPLNQTQRELLRNLCNESISAAIDAKLAPYLELCVKPLNVSGDGKIQCHLRDVFHGAS